MSTDLFSNLFHTISTKKVTVSNMEFPFVILYCSRLAAWLQITRILQKNESSIILFLKCCSISFEFIVMIENFEKTMSIIIIINWDY